MSQSPEDLEEFFASLRRGSEGLWEHVTLEHGIHGFQIQPGTLWLPGLSDAEIDRFEADLGFPFPSVYRAFLRHMNGIDLPAVNLQAEPYAYAPAYYSYPRDLETVRETIGWIYEEFGVTPELVEQRQIPHIVPVVGHRFLVADRCEGGHPVLSMYGTDTIVYASSLQSFLVNDIFRDHACEPMAELIHVPFWLDDEGRHIH